MIDLCTIYQSSPGKAKNTNFDSFPEYQRLAKHMIHKQVAPVNRDLAQHLCGSEDCVHHIATALVMADWIWNGRGSKYGFRKQRGTYAIKSMLSRYKKEPHMSPLNNYTEYIPTGNHIPDNPAKVLEQEELKRVIETMITSSGLTKLQQDYVRLRYLEGLKYKDIASRYGITPSAIEAGTKRALKKMRQQHPEVEDVYV